ncbi:MAG: hypothetical protein FWC77_03000 [Defluviitaleaceae bacterium]|nr:hypothetical protein [Defluviitaleaceae bacterium]
MHENINESLFKKQKNIRPKLEDAIADALIGDALKNAQGFILYLTENKMKPVWASASSWKVNYKGKAVCYIRLPGTAWYPLDSGSWHLSVFAQYDEHLQKLISGESEEAKEFVKNHLKKNLPCGGCMPGLDRRLVNDNFVNICACTCINMENPNDNFCGFAKKLVELRRDAIRACRVPKCNYVKPADRK